MPSDPSIEIPLTLTPSSYQSWRGVHLGSSGLVAVLALAHATFSYIAYASWSADAVWFLMPQAFAVLAGLLGQAVAAGRTLPGPA